MATSYGSQSTPPSVPPDNGGIFGTGLFGNTPIGIPAPTGAQPALTRQIDPLKPKYGKELAPLGSGRQKPDPQAGLWDMLSQMLSGGGGGGGGGGRAAQIQALLSDVDNREAKARARYDKNKADVTTMYGQLASAISGYRPTIESDYNSMSANTAQRATDQEAAISNELAAQDARRISAADSLGIGLDQLQAQPELQSNVVLNEALGNIGQTAANWGGFLEAERGNTLNRNQNQADAATGTGAATSDTLLQGLENYLQGLDSERAQIKAGAASGGGGGGSSGGGGNSALQTYLGKSLVDQLFQGPSEYEQKLGFLKKLGLDPGTIGTSLGNIAQKNGQATSGDYYNQWILGLLD